MTRTRPRARSAADLLLSKEDLFRRWASYHEAGHAVAAWRRGLAPGGLGLVVGHRGGGVYYHGGMLWRLLVVPPDLVRGTVLAGVEVFQAGLLAEYVCGSDCNLCDAASARRELSPLLDCHVPGDWGATCRKTRLSLGCGPDELDDAQRALLLLLVYSSRDEGPLVGEPHATPVRSTEHTDWHPPRRRRSCAHTWRPSGACCTPSGGRGRGAP